ncbi:2-acylglycerol O-acyltransferase 1-like protein [Leptotrombidium deliense]|uniref:diacylglycerol O-acyltransferase n=1 Tax=Leptotrombidium deliense TaxID=299467 RepID=A0A443S8D8_9ACAR|nr:2-acylglycerol O-acyltransferase 1-like protein [Leptotrombidium deliense]
MVTIFGIKLAPLFIPLNRRLQTLAVLYFGSEFLPLLFVYIAVLLYLLFTRFYFITLAYFVWYFYDLNAARRGGKRGRWLRNSSIVPVLSFGENDVYNQLVTEGNCWLRKVQRKITLLTRAPPPLFYGRGIFQYSFGLMPFRKAIVTVVGEPLNVLRNLTPTQEEINQIHEEYMKSLKKLFHENKDKYGFSDLMLFIK